MADAPPIALLAISGSLRARSSNTEILRAAVVLAPDGVRVTLCDGIAALPHFNPDLDGEGAVLPSPVAEFRSRIAAADGLLICSPEYAHGLPGVLKNALDWLVSGPEMVFKPVALLNASPHSTHAQASLAETLRTMSAVLVAARPFDVPLDRRGASAADIAAATELAGPIRSAIGALSDAAPEYRRLRVALDC